MTTPQPHIADYQLVRLIGAGSYGEVWLARSLTGLWRAIKVVRRDRFADARPFERELAGVTRYQQTVVGEPRQLALLHVGELADGGFYYVMELADDAESEGEFDPARYVPLTLKELLLRRRELPATEALRLAIDLARALASLHARGLVHRDIKPSNIILVQGLPKLADLGLVSSSDRTITSVGTPAYLPPEGAGTPRGDVYSLGKVFYELATGQSAEQFPVLPAAALAGQDAAQRLELNAVSVRAAETQPADRYADARAVLDDLLAIQAGTSVRAYALLRQRFRRLKGVALVTLALAAVLVAMFAWRAQRTERARRLQVEVEERMTRYTANLRSAVNALQRGDYGDGQRALRAAAVEPESPGFEWHAIAQEFVDDAVQRVNLTNAAPVAIDLAGDGRNGVVLGSDRKLRGLAGGVLGPVLATNLVRLAGVSPDATHVLALEAGGGFQWLPTRSDASGIRVGPPGYYGAHWPGGWSVMVDTNGAPRFTRFDLVTGQVAGRVQARSEWGGDWRTYHIAIDAEATRVAASFRAGEGLGDRYAIGVWQFSDGRLLWSMETEDPVYYPRFSRDGRWLAFTEHLATVVVCDASAGQRQQRLVGHLNRVDALEFSPDGQWLATGGGDQAVRLWDWRKELPVRVFRGAHAPIRSLAWESDGRRLLAASEDGSIRWFQVEGEPAGTRRGLRVLGDGHMGDAVVSGDGQRLLVTTPDRHVGVYRLDSLDLVGECAALYQPLFELTDGTVLGIAPDFSVRRQRPGETTDKVMAGSIRMGGKSSINATRVAADGSLLVLGGSEGQVWALDLRTFRWRFQLSVLGPWVMAVDASSRSGLVAAGDESGGLLVLRSDTGAVIARKQLGDGLHWLAFDPQGQSLFVARDDGVIEVRGLPSLELRAALTGHSRYAIGLAFVDQGRRLVSAGSDGKLVFWQVSDGRPVAELNGFVVPATGGDQSPFAFAADPAGTSLVLMTQDGWLRRWQRPAR